MARWVSFSMGMAGGWFGFLAWMYHRQDDPYAAIGAVSVAVALLTTGLVIEVW